MQGFFDMKKAIQMLAATALLGSVATVAMAYQGGGRDPAYQAARTSGLIGEGNDGYLDFVSPPSASIKALVESLNIKRKEEYTRIALETKVTVSCAAQRTARTLITTKMAPGEKYQDADGNWQTRTDAVPDVATPACGG